jgi:hypothetical protein
MRHRGNPVGLHATLAQGAFALAEPERVSRADAPGDRKLTTQLHPTGGQSAVAFDLALVKE